MFFNTQEFLFAFLPITLAGFALLLANGERRAAIWWLVLASCLFYWSLDGRHLLVLIASAAGNFLAGRLIARHREQRPVVAWRLLCAGVLLNVGAFVYFKYAFLVWAPATGWAGPAAVAVPLGLSFFTVQQIIYLLSATRTAATGRASASTCCSCPSFPTSLPGR